MRVNEECCVRPATVTGDIFNMDHMIHIAYVMNKLLAEIKCKLLYAHGDSSSQVDIGIFIKVQPDSGSLDLRTITKYS